MGSLTARAVAQSSREAARAEEEGRAQRELADAQAAAQAAAQAVAAQAAAAQAAAAQAVQAKAVQAQRVSSTPHIYAALIRMPLQTATVVALDRSATTQYNRFLWGVPVVRAFLCAIHDPGSWLHVLHDQVPIISIR